MENHPQMLFSFDLQYSRVPSHLISLGNLSAQIFKEILEVLEGTQEVELRQLFQVENNYLKCRNNFRVDY